MTAKVFDITRGILYLILFCLLFGGCYKWAAPPTAASFPFSNRTQSESHEGVTVTAAVPTREETIQIYGVDLYVKKIQPVWLEVKNATDQPVTLLTNSIDPEYFSPDETAYKTKEGYEKNAQWNREIFFQKMSLPMTIPPQSVGSGFVMTHAEKPTKYFYFDVFSEKKLRRFSFLVDIPGKGADFVEADWDKLYSSDQIKNLSLDELRNQLEALPCCAPHAPGKTDGDPLNLVIVGTREQTLASLVRAGWQLNESKELKIPSRWYPALSKRPHAPKSHTPLYVFDRPEDVGFHKPRQDPYHRTQLWLWLSPWRYEGKPVWIGSVTRDIGLRYYLKKPELLVTQNIDSDVDETRAYFLEDLLQSGAIEKVGWIRAMEATSPETPQTDALGDIWYSDGLRLVLFISDKDVEMKDVQVLKWSPAPFRVPFHAETVASCGADCENVPAPTAPAPIDYPFKNRIASETHGEVTVAAAVPSRQETRAIFKTDLYGVGIQPVWLRVTNHSKNPVSLLRTSVDPEYFSSNEAAYRSREFFRNSTEIKRASFFEGMDFNPSVDAGTTQEGFLFTHVDQGTKYFIVDLLSGKNYQRYTYLMEVPGLRVDSYKVDFDKLYPPDQIKEVTLPELRQELEKFPCCTFSKKGKLIGDPVNLVVIGNQEDALSAFIRAGWRETEIKKGQVLKTLKSYLNKTPYEYAPMSTLWLFNRPQDAGFQKPRETPHERNHFRLWLTPWRYQGKQIWIGAISRDIGLRYTTKSPFLFITHKIDSDVDETREYLLEDLIEIESVQSVGYAKGVGEVSIEHPKMNPMNDPWYSDGLRLVLFLSEDPVSIHKVETLKWELPPERNSGPITPLLPPH